MTGQQVITFFTKQVNLKLETEFYKFSRQKPSFGHFLSIFRMLSNEMPTSIFNSKFDKYKVYEKTATLIYQFNLLKEVVDDGADDNFQFHIDQIKGRSMSTNKGLLDLFDNIIIIRNIFNYTFYFNNINILSYVPRSLYMSYSPMLYKHRMHRI